jgi:hypothetical protein
MRASTLAKTRSATTLEGYSLASHCPFGDPPLIRTSRPSRSRFTIVVTRIVAQLIPGLVGPSRRPSEAPPREPSRQRASTARNQLGSGDRAPARKEGHIVAEPDKLFGQVGNDPLSAAIEPRRDALNQGSDLCDLHDDLYSPHAYKRGQCSKGPLHLEQD